MTTHNDDAACIGYGDREGICTNKAGTPWGPLWCHDCDKVRLTTISQQMTEIKASFPLDQRNP